MTSLVVPNYFLQLSCLMYSCGLNAMHMLFFIRDLANDQELSSECSREACAHHSR